MHKCPFCQECFWGIRCPQCGRNIREFPKASILDPWWQNRKETAGSHYSPAEQEPALFKFAPEGHTYWLRSYVK